MPNPIKTSADKIVEKYRYYASSVPRSTDPFWHPILAENHNATKCAILEVEACIQLLEPFYKLGYRNEHHQLNQTLQELKSRIV